MDHYLTVIGFDGFEESVIGGCRCGAVILSPGHTFVDDWQQHLDESR